MYLLSNSAIHGAELDGANRTMIASLSRYSIYGAQGIALDVDTNRIYFTASYGSRKVSYIDLNSSNRSVKTLVQLYYRFWYYGYPYGITVDDQYVYFTYQRWNQGRVYRVNKTKGNGQLAIPVMGLSYPRGVAVQGGNTASKSKYTYFLHLTVHANFF